VRVRASQLSGWVGCSSVRATLVALSKEWVRICRFPPCAGVGDAVIGRRGGFGRVARRGI